MSGLDPIRPPKSRGYARSLIVGVCVFLGMVLSMSWWNGAETWKMILAAGVSAAFGLLIARAFVKKRK